MYLSRGVQDNNRVKMEISSILEYVTEKRFMGQSICTKVAVFPIKNSYLCRIVNLIEMNFRKLLFIAAAIAAVISCKKDKDEEALPTLDGTLKISGVESYVLVGQKCELTASGVTHPDGEEIGYYWKTTPTAPTACTTKVYSITFTDTLQTCSIYCYAFADGYSSSSASAYATVVKAGKKGSIQGIKYPTDGTYETVIGTQKWTMMNQTWKGDESKGVAFRDTEAMSDIYGRYYNYNDATLACEALGEGWMLPTKEDWETLEEYIKSTPDMGKSTAAALMADATFNGTTMWEYWPAVGDITNSTGFSAIPVGYANVLTNSFTGATEYAAFWTSTSVEDDDSMAYIKYLIYTEPDLYTDAVDKKSFGASVRCIKK